MINYNIIPPKSGVSFILKKGQRLKVIGVKGEQVSDLVCFNEHDTLEYISSGRTFDYAENIFLTTGNLFYSNRSNVMLHMEEDTVGRHDFLLTPCSAETFRIMYGDEAPHCGCFGNIAEVLKQYNITSDQIPVSFNIFMNVTVDGTTGKIEVKPPLSKPGDHVIFKAEMDLIVALTSCSAGMSNNFTFKEIGWEILE